MRISTVLSALRSFLLMNVDAEEILLAVLSLALTAFGVYVVVRPRPLAEWELARRTDSDAEPSEDWLLRIRIGGALLALCGLAMLGLFLWIKLH